MSDQFQQTSFIPKKTYDVGPAPKATQSSLAGILSFIGVVFLVLSFVGAAGVFLYGRYLETSLVRKEETLEQAKAAFEPELIRELSRLDAKLSIGKRLLDGHVAPSALFDLLEDVTLTTVRFTDFAYTVTDEGIVLTMRGEAGSFASVALQSDEFTRNRSIRQPVFSGLALDSRGDVVFEVSAIIDPALLSYRERVARGGTALFDVDSEEENAGEVAGVSIQQ